MFCANRFTLTKFAGDVRGVRDRHVERVRLARVHDVGVRERQGERRVAHQHDTRRPPANRDGADRQPVQGALHFHLDDVRALAPPLDEVLGVAGLARAERRDVVAGPELAVGPGLRVPTATRGDSPAAVRAMRSGSSFEPDHVVVAWRQDDAGGQVADDEVRPVGATLATISMTLKNWFRNPMSPGMTMTPGIGGT